MIKFLWRQGKPALCTAEALTKPKKVPGTKKPSLWYFTTCTGLIIIIIITKFNQAGISDCKLFF